MATALTALQDLKECPVCRDEFTDPRALPCDHLLCQDCIDHIKKGIQIKCPVCNTVHDVRRVRRDFRLMQFLDALKEEKETKAAKNKDGEPHCAVCSSESASYWCKNCKQWMCTGCKKTHSKIASCKNHTMEPLSAKVNEVKSKFDKEAKAVKDKINSYTTAAKKIEERINSLEMTQMEALEISDGLKNKCIQDIKDFFDSIDAKILIFIQDKIGDLEIDRKELFAKLQGIEAKWKLLEEMITENSRKLVVEGPAIIEQAKQIKDSYAHFDIKANDVVVKVLKGRTWDPSTAAVLSMNGEDYPRDMRVRATGPTSGSLASIANKRFQRDKHVKLSNTPLCVRLIDDKLWVCETWTIQLFNTNLKLNRKLKNKAWGDVYDIVTAPADGVVVVSSQGLFHIQSNGKEICKIDSGDYYSGVIHNDVLFASEYKTKSILTYAYNGSWKKQNTVKLSHGEYNTLSVTDNTITACSGGDGKIYVLSHTGQVLHSYGEEGSGPAGKLSGPSLCLEDGEGALLVADRDNDRVQVLDRHRAWSIVHMEPAVKEPTRAVYMDGTLYVVSWRDNMLYAYSAK